MNKPSKSRAIALIVWARLMRFLELFKAPPIGPRVVWEDEQGRTHVIYGGQEHIITSGRFVDADQLHRTAYGADDLLRDARFVPLDHPDLPGVGTSTLPLRPHKEEVDDTLREARVVPLDHPEFPDTKESTL